MNKTIVLTTELEDALYEVYEDLANLPDDQLKYKINVARTLAKTIGIDEVDFFYETGGYELHSDSRYKTITKQNLMDERLTDKICY